MDRDAVFEEAVETFLSRLEQDWSPYERKLRVNDPWKTACIAAFWSGPLESPEEWRRILCYRSRRMANYLESSLIHFHPRTFFRFFPLKEFVREWPYMRGFCPQAAFYRRRIYDLIWSLGVSGTPHVPPMAGWFELTDDERALLFFVLRHRGKATEDYAHEFQTDPEAMRLTLEKVEHMGFIQKKQDAESEKWVRSNAYVTHQIPRPAKTIRYTVKNDGKVRATFISPIY